MLRIVVPTLALVLAGCSTLFEEPIGPPAPEVLYAVSASNRLISFNGGQPQKLLTDAPLKGLQPDERVLAIDYRVAKGQLFALGSSGRLYRVDTPSATLTAVGAPIAVGLSGTEFGFDFNPTVDRIRVVSDSGLNLRLHPETGAVVDADPKIDGVQTDGTLAYDATDLNAGQKPGVVAAGYTYNKDNEKITTNFALDARLGLLVMQGSREGVQPVISPNTGRLFTIGSLKAGPIERATFDISDVKNVAYSAITPPGATASVLYRIDLASGIATRIGTIAGGATVVGAAVEP